MKKYKNEMTGYPSIDKPWLKYYSSEAISGELPPKTIYRYIYDCNEKNMDSIAFKYFGKKITYAVFFDNIKKTASALSKAGIFKGDIVTILSLITPETLYCIYALNYIGATVNMGYLSLSGEEIIHTVNNTNSKILIVMDVIVNKVLDIQDKLQSKYTVILQTEDSMPLPIKIFASKKNHKLNNSNCITYRQFINQYYSKNLVKENAYQKDSSAMIVYTSGTTGEPKGVVLTNDNINAIAYQYKFTGFEIKSGQSILTFMPPFLAIGFCLGVHMPFSMGITEILYPNPSPEIITKQYLKNQPNLFLAAPTNVMQIIKKNKRKSMRYCKIMAGGGESMSMEQEDKVNNYLASHNSSAIYLGGYGMTEFAATVVANMPVAHKINTLGIPLCKTVVKVINTESGKECKYNEIGELCFHTPSQMKEYFKNPVETENIISKHEDGLLWIHTGDLGFVDEDGFVHFKGRIKRIYMTKGSDGTIYKVFPARIENELMKLSYINKASVIAKTDNSLLKELIVYLKLSTGITDRRYVLEQVEKYCKNVLPSHSIPDKYYVIDKIPITQSGKTDYRKLENMQ